MKFGALADFEPEPIALQVPEFRALVERRETLLEASRFAGAEAMITSQGSEDEPIALIIGDIDDRIARQLDAILKAPAFRQLEAAWRGIAYLLEPDHAHPTVKIKVLDVSREELYDDLTGDADPSRSSFYNLVYTREYGQHGGEPYSLLVGAFEHGGDAQDIELLRGISQVASAAHAPYIAAAAPALFGWGDFGSLQTDARLIRSIFEEKQDWHALCRLETSRHIGLILPRLLGRVPYDVDVNVPRRFPYRERTVAPGAKDRLWINPAFGFAACAARAFIRYGWYVAVTGRDSGGGVVHPLAVEVFETGEGDIAAKPQTEIVVTERRERELVEAGFIPLVDCRGYRFAAFFAAPSIFLDEGATERARLVTRLPYLFAASRIAHYLKVIMRERLGGYLSADQILLDLNNWLSGYTLLQDDAPPEIRAERPLRDARISGIEPDPGSGVLRARLQVRPHFQVDDIDVSVVLETELPKLAKAG